MQTTPPIVTRSQGKSPGLVGWLLLAPMIFWLVAFVIAPTAILLVASFARQDVNGFPDYQKPLTSEHYERIAKADGKWITTEKEDIVKKNAAGEEEVVGTKNVTRLASPYFRIFGWSVFYAALTTVLCVVVGFPVAWFIGRASEGKRNLLLMLVMIPFWTSFLIRTYAWVNILANEGMLNGFLLYTKIISEPFEMLYTPGAVVLGLFYSYLPFMILPIYSSVEKLDNSLVEAAFDLGAGPIRAFRKVILPLTRPGIVAGVIFVFVPAVGMFAISRIMGGGVSQMIGEKIEDQFGSARNWPFGSALGMTLVALFAIAFVATSKLRAPRT